MDARLERLRAALEDSEWELLMHRTGGGSRMPFDAPEQIDALLASADDATVELFAKCEMILEEAPAAQSGTPHEDSLVYVFDLDALELGHFLGSLRRNGFRTATVEGAQATVHVWLDATTDQEFFLLKETVRSLYEFTRLARGRNPKGRRLHSL